MIVRADSRLNYEIALETGNNLTTSKLEFMHTGWGKSLKTPEYVSNGTKPTNII